MWFCNHMGLASLASVDGEKVRIRDQVATEESYSIPPVLTSGISTTHPSPQPTPCCHLSSSSHRCPDSAMQPVTQSPIQEPALRHQLNPVSHSSAEKPRLTHRQSPDSDPDQSYEHPGLHHPHSAHRVGGLSGHWRQEQRPWGVHCGQGGDHTIVVSTTDPFASLTKDPQILGPAPTLRRSWGGLSCLGTHQSLLTRWQPSSK